MVLELELPLPSLSFERDAARAPAPQRPPASRQRSAADAPTVAAASVAKPKAHGFPFFGKPQSALASMDGAAERGSSTQPVPRKPAAGSREPLCCQRCCLPGSAATRRRRRRHCAVCALVSFCGVSSMASLWVLVGLLLAPGPPLPPPPPLAPPAPPMPPAPPPLPPYLPHEHPPLPPPPPRPPPRQPPPLPAAPPFPPAPPSPPPNPKVLELNARFRRSPFTAEWSADGALADAGILVHITDGWEENKRKPWAPALNGPGATQQSASLIFAEQRRAGASIYDFLFGKGKRTSAIVFKPGATKLLCGKAVDSAGSCGEWCDPSRNDTSIPWDESEKLCSWRVEDFGVSLQRLHEWMVNRRRPGYDEIIVDAVHWRRNLPDVIDGIVNNEEGHAAFLKEFWWRGVTRHTHPHLVLDEEDWENPFR